MMAAKHARITLTPGGHGSTFEVDGQRLTGIRGFTLQGSVMEMNQLTLDLVIREAEVDGQVLASIPEKTRETLIALGWKPPDGDTGQFNPVPAPGEPAELASLPVEVRALVHAVDKMRDDWAEADEARRDELWRSVHTACDAVWNILDA
jgi:hypothetical protein